MQPEQPDVSKHAWLQGGGQMGERIRSHGWSKTPLGDPAAWPQALRTYVGLILASAQPMWVAWGPSLTWISNDAFIPILGSKYPQALGRPALLDVWAEASEVLTPMFDQVLSGVPIHMQDFALNLDRNGRMEEAHFAFSYTPARDETGRVAGIFCACIETTSQVISERRQAAAQERQRHMFEQAPSFVCIMGGPQHVFEFVNNAHRKLFNSGGWLGKPVREAFPDIAGQGYFEQLDKVFQSGKPFIAKSAPVRYRLSPELEEEERLLDFIYEPVVDHSGQITGIFCEGFDVTAQRIAEDALRASEAKYRTLFDSIDEGFCILQLIFDPQRRAVDYRYAEINPAFERQSGLTDALGKTVNELVRDHEPHWFETYGNVVLTGEPVRFVSHAESMGRWFDVYAFRMGTQVESKVAVLFKDVTSLKAAEQALNNALEALQESDRRKDEFIATLAHELRNPLAPIKNGLQIARLSNQADATLQRTLQMMDRQLEHLVRLVNDLLDIGRISAGKIELRRTRLRLHDVLARSIESAQTVIDMHRHTLAVDFDAEEFQLEGDFDRLSQVFSNLLSNAAKYTDSGGQIMVTLRREALDVVVRIRDTGIGIPADDIAQVFDLFSQVRVHQGRAEGGLGIGLALVRKLVEMHAGRVGVESQGLGTGSTFTVRLPLAVDSRPPTEVVPEDLALDDAAITRRVLVVDDNVDAANSLAALLEMCGHAAHVANEGQDALEKFARIKPDLVFLDLGMPQMDGFEIAGRIRGSPDGRKTTLVALTGWGQDKDRERTRAAGFNHHIVKPMTLESLQTVLHLEPDALQAR